MSGSFYVLLVRHVANVDIYENFVNRLGFKIKCEKS